MSSALGTPSQRCCDHRASAQVQHRRMVFRPTHNSPHIQRNAEGPCLIQSSYHRTSEAASIFPTHGSLTHLLEHLLSVHTSHRWLRKVYRVPKKKGVASRIGRKVEKITCLRGDGTDFSLGLLQHINNSPRLHRPPHPDSQQPARSKEQPSADSNTRPRERQVDEEGEQPRAAREADRDAQDSFEIQSHHFEQPRSLANLQVKSCETCCSRHCTKSSLNPSSGPPIATAIHRRTSLLLCKSQLP